MVIRRAVKNDVDALLLFAAKVVDYHAAIDAYYRSSRAFDRLEEHVAGWLHEAGTLLLVAEQNGTLVGYFRGSVEAAPEYALPAKIGVVYDIFVEKPYRRQGLGVGLFNEAMNWFRAKKVKNVELSVDARNKSAVAFWKKLGFFGYKIKMRLDL